jgi:short subunit dehydrogenase-like uncharacterized protein
MDVPFRDQTRSAVTIPWGDVASAWHSTGIPNIEVYLAMSRRQIAWLGRMRLVVPALRFPLPQWLLRAGIRRFLLGPSPKERGASRGSFWGRASDAEGNSVEATLTTPGGYALTVSTALASLAKVLAGEAPPGFSTPSKAFGAEFILSLPETDFRWEGR